jgi:hypothetical protein
MKKQLLIAAVAASMTSVAMADISITGGAKVNYVYTQTDNTASTNAINHDIDLDIVGKNGDTTVVVHIGGIEASGTADMATENVYLTTKIGDINVKTGNWDNGNNLIRSSGRKDGKISLSTTVQGVTVTFDDAEDSNATLKVAGSVSGVDAYFKKGTITDDFGLKTTVGGVTVNYNSMGSDSTNSDRDSIRVDGSVSGIALTYAAANADSSATIGGDDWLGNYESTGTTLDQGADVSGFGASMAIAGNTVQVRSITVDQANDIDYTKFYVTRKLSNGTTFEAVYTDKDVAGSTASDSETLDLELAVSF